IVPPAQRAPLEVNCPRGNQKVCPDSSLASGKSLPPDVLTRNVEVQDRDQLLGLCSRGQSAFRFIYVTPIHYPDGRQDARQPPSHLSSRRAATCCAATYSMKRQTTLLAAALLGLAV